jgi:hypothetical protein
MNLRSKMQVLSVILGILLILVLGLGLTSFFSLSKLTQARSQNLQQQLYLFERSMEDVRTCLDAEEYSLAKIRLAEALELLKTGENAARGQEKFQKSFQAIRVKYCSVWNSSEWGYRSRASNHPELAKGFDTLCP